MVKKVILAISAALFWNLGSAYAQESTDPTLDATTVTATPVSTPNTPPGPIDITTPNDDSNISVTPATSTSGIVITPTSTVTTPTTTDTSGLTTSPTPTAASGGLVTTFTCVGNNPSWNLSISRQFITYSSSKNAEVRVKAVTPLTPIGDTSGTLQVFSTRADDKPITILVRKNPAGCTGGLPGQSYQYDTFVVFSNMVVAGCCNPA